MSNIEPMDMRSVGWNIIRTQMVGVKRYRRRAQGGRFTQLPPHASFPRKRESRATAPALALDPRFRGVTAELVGPQSVKPRAHRIALMAEIDGPFSGACGALGLAWFCEGDRGGVA